MLEEDGGCGWMDEGIGVCGPYKVLAGGVVEVKDWSLWVSECAACGRLLSQSL